MANLGSPTKEEMDKKAIKQDKRTSSYVELEDDLLKITLTGGSLGSCLLNELKKPKLVQAYIYSYPEGSKEINTGISKYNNSLVLSLDKEPTNPHIFHIQFKDWDVFKKAINTVAGSKSITPLFDPLPEPLPDAIIQAAEDIIKLKKNGARSDSTDKKTDAVESKADVPKPTPHILSHPTTIQHVNGRHHRGRNTTVFGKNL